MCKTNQKSKSIEPKGSSEQISKSNSELQSNNQVKQDQNMLLSGSEKYTVFSVPCLQMASSHIGNISESVNF